MATSGEKKKKKSNKLNSIIKLALTTSTCVCLCRIIYFHTVDIYLIFLTESYYYAQVLGK